MKISCRKGALSFVACAVFVFAFLAASGGFAQNASPASADPAVTITDNGTSWTLDNGIVKATITNNGGERAEVSIKGVGGGTFTFTRLAPGGGTTCDIELRYSLGRGDHGLYTY